MSFRISGLDPAPFRSLYGLTDDQLASKSVQRVVADTSFGFPDRIELRDAAAGETLLLLNHVHQPARTPYRASHAIFVREGADAACEQIDRVPDALLRRTISLRAYDRSDMMIAADLAGGEAVERLIHQMLTVPEAAYLHAHFAKRGCYAALITRA